MKGNKTYSLELMINGKWKRAEVTPEETLLHLLREKEEIPYH